MHYPAPLDIGPAKASERGGGHQYKDCSLCSFRQNAGTAPEPLSILANVDSQGLDADPHSVHLSPPSMDCITSSTLRYVLSRFTIRGLHLPPFPQSMPMGETACSSGRVSVGALSMEHIASGVWKVGSVDGTLDAAPARAVEPWLGMASGRPERRIDDT